MKPSGRPIRPNGIKALNFSFTLSGTDWTIGVSMKPGKTALHLMLYLAMGEKDWYGFKIFYITLIAIY